MNVETDINPLQTYFKTINGFADSIAQAIEEMKAEQRDSFSLESTNMAELERRTGVLCDKLRRLKRNGFQDLPHKTKWSKHKITKLSSYTGLIDSLLRQGSKNSSVILDRLRQAGYEGGATIVKNTSPRTSISCRPSASRSRRRAIAAVATRQKHYEWGAYCGVIVTCHSAAKQRQKNPPFGVDFLMPVRMCCAPAQRPSRLSGLSN